jgi:RimJ/RimL family protein N-acetyltransferase
MVCARNTVQNAGVAVADGEFVVMLNDDVAAMDDPDMTLAFIEGRVEEMARGDAFYWSVRRTADGTFLGSVDLTDIDRRHHRAEIGFVLARPVWGQGYGYEAVQAVLGHAATLGFRRLWARTQVGDNASEKLLTKLGFEVEGYMKGHVDRDGERRDCRLWGLLL